MLEDWLTERGASIRWRLSLADAAAATATAAAAAAATDAAAAAATDAATAAATDADADAIHNLYSGDFQMVPHLQILVSQAGYYCLTRIGWVRHKSGDEWEIVNSRTVRGRDWSAKSLTSLALSKGKAPDHAFDEINPVPEPVWRVHCVRPIPIAEADWASWANVCPMPEGWVK